VASNEGNRKVLVFDPHMHVKKTMTIEDFEEQSAKKKVPTLLNIKVM